MTGRDPALELAARHLRKLAELHARHAERLRQPPPAGDHADPWAALDQGLAAMIETTAEASGCTRRMLAEWRGLGLPGA